MSQGMYDIRAEIRAVVETSGLTDPGDIAAKVTANVPARDLRPVLASVLRDTVRIELHAFTRWPQTTEQPAARPARSAKVAAVRAWARLLAKPVAVAGNEWKRFGECSRDDLAYLSTDRRRDAADNLAKAERFEKYDAALAERGVDRVADLPDDVIAAIEGEATS